jgi:hypothetical protein
VELDVLVVVGSGASVEEDWVDGEVDGDEIGIEGQRDRS